MKYRYRFDYKELSDQQIVEKILAVPHDEEAAVYLLQDRYNPLLHKLYNQLTKDATLFDDCVNELFIHMKGQDGSWHTLATFQWRSTFGYWLRGVAFNKFRDVLAKLIENDGHNISIDSEDPERPKVQIHDGGEESYERIQRKIMLIEAIEQLKDEDQRFVILKRLQGYRSKEIAILLKNKWQKHGIRKYNNKNELVVPDAGYIDVLNERAKEILRMMVLD